MDALTYSTRPGLVNSTPLKGRYLSRSLGGKHERAFIGADLYRGDKQLVEPSLALAALIVGSDPTAVFWAVKRENFRTEILNDELPLVPARLVVSKTNGHALVVPNSTKIDDFELVNIARCVGAERMLAAAVAVEKVTTPSGNGTITADLFAFPQA